MSQTHNFQPLAPIQFVDQVDVAPHSYSGQAFNVYRVNATEDGLQPIAISTMTGSGANNIIPTFTGSVAPVLQSSPFSAYVFGGVYNVLDLNPVDQENNVLIFSIADQIILGAGLLGTHDADILISNASVATKDINIMNSAPNGQLFGIADNVYLRDQTNNNQLFIDANETYLANQGTNMSIDMLGLNMTIDQGFGNNLVLPQMIGPGNLQVDGSGNVSVGSNNVQIPSLLVNNLAQIIGPSTTGLINGVSFASFGISGGTWVVDTFTPGSSGLFEVNLSWTSASGTSSNYTMQPQINAVNNGVVMAVCGNFSNSYSGIYNMVGTDQLTFLITNADALLNVSLDSMNMTIKRINNFMA